MWLQDNELNDSLLKLCRCMRPSCTHGHSIFLLWRCAGTNEVVLAYQNRRNWTNLSFNNLSLQ